LVHQSVHLFSKIIEIKDAKALQALFDVKIDNYWEMHYVFDKESVKRKKSFGKTSIELLMINTVAPFLFLYGRYRQEEDFKDRALALLEAVPSERNSIMKQWEVLGMKPSSAYQSQALLQLKNEYCKKKNCLNCSIGNWRFCWFYGERRID